MYYSEEVIESVRDANNIVDVIGTYVPLKKKGSTYFGPCPFHSEKTPSFSVTDNPERKMFYCFGCHAAGDVFTFVMKYENLSYIESVQMLAERAGITLPAPDYSKERAERDKKKQQILEINKLAAVYFYDLLKSERGRTGLEYLKKRGLSNKTIVSFGLGYSDKYKDDLYKYIKEKGYSDELLKESGLFVIKEKGSRDYFWNRVMFPIMDVRNKVVGFGGRVMGDGEPKYLNSPETICFNKSQTLYGLNIAKKSRGREIILVEGYMDVISLHQSGFTNAVAGLGTALTDGNVSILRRYADTVILSYDSDTAGRNATLRAISKLRTAGLSIKVVNLRPYKDPDELIKAEGAEEYRNRLSGAMNALIYEIYALKESYDLNDPDGKSSFYNETAKKISEFDDEIERDSYALAVSREFFIDLDILKNAIKKYALTRSGEGFFVRPEKPAKQSGLKKNAIDTCAKIVLSYVASDMSFYERIRGILSEECFPEGFYRDAALILFSQRASGRLASEEVIDAFPEIEEREKISEIFYFSLESESKEETEKTLNDCVVKLKRADLEKQISETDDIGKIISLKKESEALLDLDIFA